MTYANQIAFLKATRGEQVSKAYSSWLNMRRRVRSPRGKKEKCYKNLSIQTSWNDFEVFLKEMGLPKLNESIDRIDNSLGYSKENCRWADATIQSRNRKCVKLNIDAVKQIKQEYFETKTTQQNLAIKYGVSQHMISCVVRNKFWATC
jgi:hypothetical protein